MIECPAHLAIIRNVDDLHAALRARAETLGVTRETIDSISGMQQGYASKLLAPRPLKKIGPQSMGLILPALGCALVLIVDDAAMLQVGSRLVKRDFPNRAHSAVVHYSVSLRFLRKIGRKGGANSRKNLTPQKRRRLARKAANARWHKPKLVEVKARDAKPARHA